MATETGIIMLVYLRRRSRSEAGLPGSKVCRRVKVIEGAVQSCVQSSDRGDRHVGLAPMSGERRWAEVIAPCSRRYWRPIADEVIDIFLPVLFYQVEKRRWLKTTQRGTGPAVEECS